MINATSALMWTVLPATAAVAQSNVDPDNKFAWGENFGWTNWRDANGGLDGVVIGDSFLSGFIWAENVGWINVGNGNGPYANTDNTNFGVNIGGGGDLDGFAWGENIGWVNFDTSSAAPDQARYDAGAGRFRGYAWGENVGWINLDDGTHFVGVEATAALPGIESVVTVNDHDGIGSVGVPVDIAASVGVDSGAVATESRQNGVTRLEITFVDQLDASVATLNEAAVTITPNPGVGVATSLANGDLTLVLEFSAAWRNAATYAVALTEAVIAASTATAGDRDFELRALLGNVAHESGAGPQEVNALDLGLAGGIRGKFGADVNDPENARFDVTQNGVVDALDLSCVRLTCGAFATTAP